MAFERKTRKSRTWGENLFARHVALIFSSTLESFPVLPSLHQAGSGFGTQSLSGGVRCP